MRLVVALLVTLGVACGGRPSHPAPAAPEPPELAHLDVYGSRQVDRAKLIAAMQPQLVALVRGVDGARADVEARIARLGTFASVEIGAVTYYKPTRTFVTIDLVDEADRAVRMTFAPEPTGELPDPDGLIALWNEYEPAFQALLQQNAVDFAAPCPFWHCLGFGHPSLAKYRDAFAARVPAVEAELAKVLREDRRFQHRAAAAFLLAHVASGERVVEHVLPAIRDPNTLVRNNALRVLALMAVNHKEVAIPVPPLLEALRFPTQTDRDKAAAVLAGLAENPALSDANRALILRGGGDILLDMFAMRNPNDHDWSYRVLKGCAKQDLGATDVEAWRRWVHAVATP